MNPDITPGTTIPVVPLMAALIQNGHGHIVVETLAPLVLRHLAERP